jgi:hypothetical protein
VIHGSGAIGRTIARYMKENMSDRAAGLTYYSLLSLFPAMLVIVALVGLLGQYPETPYPGRSFHVILRPARQLDLRGSRTRG